MGDPVVKELDGTYHHDRRKHILEWRLPVIDQSTTTGSVEFSIQGGAPDDFFPVRVTFTSPKLYCRLQVSGVYERAFLMTALYCHDSTSNFNSRFTYTIRKCQL